MTASPSDLLDSTLHAPQAVFGDIDLYPTLLMKAVVLCHRISKNHPLPDGNKRLAWMCLVIFLDLNGHTLHVPEDDAVNLMLELAAGEINEEDLAKWLTTRVNGIQSV